VKTVLPDIDIVTAAVVVPTTLMHVHHVVVKFKEGGVRRDDIVSVLDSARRIILVDTQTTGIKSTAQLIEAARDIRHRSDIPELVIFSDSIHVENGEMMLFQAVHQESIVVPENVDVIRAMLGLEQDAEKSMEKTDSVLGLSKKFFLTR
jgi:glyceraldehyde-3-phosphate dehydrogenase (NAD(P))